MKKQILVVDDMKTNHSILYSILSEEYEVFQAYNGKEAINMIGQTPLGNTISAIILDLIMPIMDGFEFLNLLSESDKFKNLPVLVVTASNATNDEVRALQLGAWDLITKPYDSVVLQHRLTNIIARSQLQVLKDLEFLEKYDSLTGIYNKVSFLKETPILIQRNLNVQFALIHMNIKHFKLVNSFLGIETGDRFLKLIAEMLRTLCEKNSLSTYARIETDVFAFCIPYDKKMIEREIERIREILRVCSSQFLLHPSFGIYVVQDPLVATSLMLDCATIAARSINRNYNTCFIYYTEKMHIVLEQEQEMISQMEQALINEEFEVWFQPKFHVVSQECYGAEALVRWRHPDKGIIYPSLFVPIFEANGLIQRLDMYVWRKTCECLRKWKNMGLTIKPISVNVSRADLYNPRLPRELASLIAQYDIPASYMPLEITESIFAEDVSLLKVTIKNLRNLGFSIFMDDFGSGYSSLNVLKDVSIDTLKIDMRFLSDTNNNEKSRIIINSVVQMAKKLGLETIMEGVEQEEQAEFLKKIDCDYIQGFLYAKPMPAFEYQALISSK